MTYENLKNWFSKKENQNKIALGASFILVFLIGFGTGGYTRETRRDAYKPQYNYTTQQTKKPAADVAKEGIVPVAATGTQASTCAVKGNISADGKKTYHILGGAYYKIVKPEQCFNTEEEAVAAGYKKSAR